MSRTLPFGTYLEGSGIAYELDARVKLLLLLLITVAAFGAASPWVVVLLAGGAFVGARLVGVPARAVMASLKPTAVVLVLAMVCNTLVADASGDVALVGTLGVSLSGAVRGGIAVCRIVALVAWCAVLSATTTAAQIVDALTSWLRPLARLGVPVEAVAMTLSLVLRFVPFALEEVGRLREAQSARGVDFDRGPLRVRLSRWTSILVPLVVSLFRRAQEVSEALQDRCWGMVPVKTVPSRLGARDWAALLGGVIVCVLCCMAGR